MFFQVSMAMYGFDVPNSRKPSDAQRRRAVFDVIKPYVFSRADYREMDSYKEDILEIWLLTILQIIKSNKQQINRNKSNKSRQGKCQIIM